MRFKLVVGFLVLAAALAACASPINMASTPTVSVESSAPKDGTLAKASPTPVQGAKVQSPTAVPQSNSGDRKLILTEGSSRVEDGFIKISGEVKNTSSNWAKSVRIDINLLDAGGKVISEERVYASVERVAPGGTTPFQLIQDVKHVAGTYASHKMDVSALISEPSATPTLEGVTSQLNDVGYYEASGKYVNASSMSCHNPQVVAVGYTSDGKVYDVDEVPLEKGEEFISDMAPGESAPFKLLMDNQSKQITSMKFFASCGG